MYRSTSIPSAAGDMYERQAHSLVASWACYATASEGAVVHDEPGVHVAVFPSEPERTVYNNALLARDLSAGQTAIALDAVERRYADAQIDSYAVWFHESEDRAIGYAESRGYRFAESTRAMAMTLDEIAVDRPNVDLGEQDWDEFLQIIGAPDKLLEMIDPSAFHVLLARLDGRNVAGAMAYDFEGDCGIYNVGTLPEARRRGLGTALTALHLHNARDRSCTTASLQSSEMAEGVYASVGFRDLGRYLEYVR